MASGSPNNPLIGDSVLVAERDQSTASFHPKEALKALVLDARLRQSLVTVRSLGSCGIGVAALETSSNLGFNSSVPTFLSRWCQQKFVAPA